MTETEGCAIKLIRYILNGDVPTLPESIDFAALYKFSSSHGVENMVYAALERLGAKIPEPTAAEFAESYDMAIANEAMQSIELEQITEAFEKAGIDNVPLKGSVIKHLYPMPDYRKSGDIDILIHPEDEEKVKGIMEEIGYQYQINEERHEIHSVYKKEPNILVEIHRKLLDDQHRSKKFCEQIWRFTRLNNGLKHTYCMDMNFFYVFTIAHLCKHLYAGGAGIRLITDIWILITKVDIDNEEVSYYLNEANLKELNDMAVKISYKWFASEYIYDDESLLLEKIILDSGSFGTHDIQIRMQAADRFDKKIKKIIRRIFPRAKTISDRYPILKQKSYLLPFFWIYRFFELVFREKDMSRQKLREIFYKSKESDAFYRIVAAVSQEE